MLIISISIIVLLFLIYDYIQNPSINYCYVNKPYTLKNTPYLQNQVIEDYEKVIPYIHKFAPVVYFHKEEKYFPISMEEYIGNSGVYHREKLCDTIVIPVGQVTMKKLYDIKDPDTYIHIDQCKRTGANPDHNKIKKGNQNILNTTAYVLSDINPDKTYLYLQYIFLYAFNAPYAIKEPLWNKTLIEKDYFGFQNGHECDIERIGILINLKEEKMEKIYYSAHGSKEGLWIDLPNNIVEFDKDTGRPIIYSALGSHANNPSRGINVRNYGFSNDVYRKDIRWVINC